MLKAHERLDANRNLWKVHVVDPPTDRDDLSRWSEDRVIKEAADLIAAGREDEAEQLASRYVVIATKLAPASPEMARHVAWILDAARTLLRQEAMKEMARTYTPPAPTPVDRDSVRLDSRIRDYCARHPGVTYDQGYQVIARDPEVTKAYTRRPER